MATRIMMRFSGRVFPDQCCKESPLEILEKIGTKYNVTGYKSIELACFGSFGNDEYRIILKVFGTPDLSVSQSFDESRLSEFPEIDLTQERQEAVLSQFIRKYFVKEVVSPAFFIMKQENYFKSRMKNPEVAKEFNLKDFLEYSRVLTGNKNLHIFDLERFALKGRF